MSVVIETTVGDITVDLYTKERPNTCLNFLKLCKIKFYNFCIFYKIEKNFIAQTGDPTATGRGGESVFCHLYGDQAKYFDAEFKPRLKHEKLGTLSMVNNGSNMNGSQFFLTLSTNLTYLDENHTVFGEVAEGLDVLLKLNDAICDNNNRPYQDIRITHTVILHDPFEDPKGLEIPDASPVPTKEMLESNYIGADEEIDDNKGKTNEEIEEKIKESEAKARATILEMVGDIPDADVKPPENVLFVCKLNPVTTSEDLEIIFSRFGKILSCEVIKDKKTEESLQYAFIEFEREEDCEAAYFKMDNVLIDDRRIHVDFSQSVSKLYFNRGKIPNTKEFKSNLSLKKTAKNDGYDLIFDTENDEIANNQSHKSKSSELSSKYKNPSKSKHSFYEERRKSNRDKEDEFNSYRKNKDDKYKHSSVKESYRNREYDYRSSNKSESERDKTYRYKGEYSGYADRSRELRSDRNYQYRDAEYSYSARSRDSYQKSKSRNSLNSMSQNYRNSEHQRKLSPEIQREYRTSSKTYRYDSVSPDQSKRSYDKHREQSYDYSKKKKYFDKATSDVCVTKIKKTKSKSKDVAVKEKMKSYPHKKKSSEKSHSLKKQKSKRSRSSSVSSSSSYSSSSSSSSSYDSESDSSSSYVSKNKRKYPKEKQISDSTGKTMSHKRKRGSS